MLSSKLMFIGGRPRTTSVQQLTHATNHNFKGCFKQVGFLFSLLSHKYFMLSLYILNIVWGKI